MPQSITCVRICFFADLLFRFQRVTPFPTFSVAEKRRGLLLALSPSVKKFFRFFFRSPQQLIAIQELTQKNRHRPTTSRRQLQLPNFFLF